MTCREFTERLPDHLEGTLPARSDRAARRHRARCRACAAYVAEYRATVAALREFSEWDDLAAEEAIDLPDLLTRSLAGPVH